MSALSAIEAPVVVEAEGEAAISAPGRQPLRLVRPAPATGPKTDHAHARRRPEPRSSSTSGASVGPTDEVLTPSAVIGPRRARATAAPPLRLTRRGRTVVAMLVVAVAAAVSLVIGLAAAGGVQAANHGQPGGGYQGMHQIVVRPGQTLWSIATAAEPSADPRDVVQQIMAANAMTTASISAGQLLWVPR